MNEQQLAAVKQALEAFDVLTINDYSGYECSKHEADKIDEAITALQSIISQDALDKKAENARELGLSYDDEPKIGCVNHDCDQCKAVQEPVLKDNSNYRLDPPGLDQLYTTPPAATVQCEWCNGRGVLAGHAQDGSFDGEDCPHCTPPAPQPVSVKTYHDGKPWPVAPKPWVGLTIGEIQDLIQFREYSPFALAEDIEAKLREKNGGAA